MQRKGISKLSKCYCLDILCIWDSKAHVVEVHTFPVYISLSFYLYFCKECFVLWLLIGFMVCSFGKSNPPSIITLLRNPLLIGLSLKAGFIKMQPLTKVGFLLAT
jgi:hypothetical protein